MVEGKVNVRPLIDQDEDKHKVLLKHEAVSVVENDLVDSRFIANEILWKDGVLVFSNENIHSIAAKMQRWFNVDVRIKNQSLIATNFSGKYANENLEKILIGMGFSMNFSAEIKGNEIFITGKHK